MFSDGDSCEGDQVAYIDDDRYAEAVEIVVELGQASLRMLQRKMRVNYACSQRLIDRMEKQGIVARLTERNPQRY